ncbi:DUF4407 domain-containing protein [Modestobacter lapidis]|nr:DUF4407 domain-containing protein [Modestobacter lapidis]
MSARKRSSGDRLAVLAGARLDLLAVAPGARSKFVALGGVLLSTGALAALSAAFAVHMALGAPWAVAVLIGLGWGLVIINLDRMLLVGMGHDSSWVRNIGLAVPRIALAAVLGTVISTPLTLQVFDKEIEATMVTLQAEAAQEFTTELNADARYAQIPTLQQRVADEQAVIASGGMTDPNADPRVGTAQAERDARQAAYAAAQARAAELNAKAQCELDGTCGSGEAGTGDAYLAAAAAASQQATVTAAAKADLDAADAELRAARTEAGAAAEAADRRSVAQAEADIVTDQAELARLTDARNAEQAAFEAENGESNGILARLEAMDRLAEDRPTLGTAHLMLFLLFLSIEILPVLMKVMLNFSPPTGYDRMVTLREDEEVEAEEIRREGRRRAQQARADLVVAAETDRMAREILDREMAARDEAARIAARRAQAGPLSRMARGLRAWTMDALRPSRGTGPEQPAEELDLRVDTGELERLMADDLGRFDAAVRRSGRPEVPAPRSTREDVLVEG